MLMVMIMMVMMIMVIMVVTTVSLTYNDIKERFHGGMLCPKTKNGMEQTQKMKVKNIL